MRPTGVLVIGMILLAASEVSGCISVYPGDVTYTGSGLRFSIQSNEPVPDAVLEVAVFREAGLSQVEIFRNADHMPLNAGETIVTLPVSLKPGKYRCFIYTSSGTRRFPAVIRDFEIT
ncbi:MAG TPA: hypothetical protein VMS89_08775 [Methanoregulaceae archaeon]|nr:hypothetical protein [Methanoregulaceae archaeon]